MLTCSYIHASHHRLDEALTVWEDGYNKGENLVTMGKKSDCINLGIGYRVCR